MRLRANPLTAIVLILTAVATSLSSVPAQESASQVRKLPRADAWAVYGYDPSADFRAYAPDYRAKINKWKDELEAPRREMFRQARLGRKTKCARQVYVEAHWLVQYTAEFAPIASRIAALHALLQQPADPPQTGFWGCWYKTKDGGIRKTADMSATFHIVHYRRGKVKHWPQIIATTLAMKNLEWPFGWLQEGEMSDHHNYDVVALFHDGWPAMTVAQKAAAKTEIRRMLNFCLTKSLRPDGSFNLGDEGTIGESFAFPCLFLHEVGFFGKENRFWTNEEFPHAKGIAKRIAHKIRELKLDDPETQVAQLIVESAQ